MKVSLLSVQNRFMLMKIDHLNSTSIHKTASVFATAGGQRMFVDSDLRSNDSEYKYSEGHDMLKLWVIEKG